MPVTDSAASEVAAAIPRSVQTDDSAPPPLPDDDDVDHQTVVDHTAVDFGGIAVRVGAWDMKLRVPIISRMWCNTFVDRNGMIARMALLLLGNLLLRKWYLDLECSSRRWCSQQHIPAVEEIGEGCRWTRMMIVDGHLE